jgi:hypothetical protein
MYIWDTRIQAKALLADIQMILVIGRKAARPSRAGVDD